MSMTGCHRKYVVQLVPLGEAFDPIEGQGERQGPERVAADRDYDHDEYRELMREREVEPIIARRGTEHGSDLVESGG